MSSFILVIFQFNSGQTCGDFRPSAECDHMSSALVLSLPSLSHSHVY